MPNDSRFFNTAVRQMELEERMQYQRARMEQLYRARQLPVTREERILEELREKQMSLLNAQLAITDRDKKIAQLNERILYLEAAIEEAEGVKDAK